MRADPAAGVAQALAWGFLAAPAWTRRGLRAAGRRAVGRRRLLARVVRRVLDAHRTAPADRPSALARFVLADEAFVDAVHRAAAHGVPVRVRRVAVHPGAMGVRRWPVPPVDDLPAWPGCWRCRRSSCPG